MDFSNLTVYSYIQFALIAVLGVTFVIRRFTKGDHRIATGVFIAALVGLAAMTFLR